MFFQTHPVNRYNKRIENAWFAFQIIVSIVSKSYILVWCIVKSSILLQAELMSVSNDKIASAPVYLIEFFISVIISASKHFGLINYFEQSAFLILASKCHQN